MENDKTVSTPTIDKKIASIQKKQITKSKIKPVVSDNSTDE